MGCDFICGQCDSVIRITSRGQLKTFRGEQVSVSTCAPAGPQTRGTSQKQSHSTDEACAPTICKKVIIKGVAYTTLACFLGVGNPAPRLTSKVIACCSSSAVELSGGDFKTLVSKGFAQQGQGKELLPGAVSLSRKWVSSRCGSVRRRVGWAKLRRAPPNNNKCRGILWRLADLRRCLEPKAP